MDKYTIKELLNIPEYKVTKIISKNDEEIHIKVEPYKWKKVICSGCGQIHKTGYHSSREVIVEDRALCEKRSYLHLVKRNCRCSKDGRIYTEEIPWLNKWSRFTTRFSKEVNRLTAITTNQEAGWFFGLNDEVIYRMDREILENLFDKKLNPTPASLNISVDEVAWKKHYYYLTNVIDVDEKVVTWNAKGRKTEILNKYYDSIGKENCTKIESVALDGAQTYISSTNKYAVNATVVLDRFHAVQKANKAIDQVRKDELHKARKNKDQEFITLANCKQRFLLLKKKSKLSDKQSVTLKRLCDLNEPIYKAMLLKDDFMQIYEYENIDEAKEHIVDWADRALFSGLKPFIELACSVIGKMQYILNWFKKKISSAISEGFNNKVKRLKRMAYGYKDIDYFRLKIHQHCGYLNPRRYQLN
jgi:transposase